MAEDSGDVHQPNIIGPDLFGFYKHEIVDLLTQDESSPFPNRTSVKGAANAASSSSSSSSKGLTLNRKRLEPDVPLFGNSLDDAVPIFRRDLLKASLRQSVTALTQEIDEMVDPVIRTRHVLACLKSNDEKLCTDAEKETGEVNEDLQFLLGSETGLVEQIMTKQSNEYYEVLNHMEHQLEEILDALVLKCRVMTHQEKQQLGKLIQQLPPRNLDRIVQIIHRGKSVSSDEVNIDLEQLDNATLWRLSFYTRAVKNATKLSALQS